MNLPQRLERLVKHYSCYNHDVIKQLPHWGSFKNKIYKKEVCSPSYSQLIYKELATAKKHTYTLAQNTFLTLLLSLKCVITVRKANDGKSHVKCKISSSGLKQPHCLCSSNCRASLTQLFPLFWMAIALWFCSLKSCTPVVYLIYCYWLRIVLKKRQTHA